MRYHFRELSTVTDEAIEAAVNEAIADGWHFDGMHFAMTPASKRPAMAFLAFTREEEDVGDDG
ncbi:MAG: DUF4177 domain-containing protein [Deltaproteobacteria bacterium]|nr:MAG: DUF4177 domain-containing protein [Deltaproteobacteria bacterium]